jgi:hypothetical protein
LVTPVVDFSSRKPANLAHKGVRHCLLEEIPHAGPTISEQGVRSGAEQARLLYQEAGITLLSSSCEVSFCQDTLAEEVLFRELHPFELNSLVDRDSQVKLGRPLVLGVDVDVICSVWLLHRDHIRIRDERVLPQNPPGFLKQEWVETVVLLKQHLSQYEALTCGDMQ